MRRLTVSTSFREYVLAQLEDLGDVRGRSMFGGVGLYRGDVFFGIIATDVLYLKVDEGSRRMFEDAGMPPFRPFEDRAGTTQYFQVPLEVLESSAELTRWAARAVEAAGRSAASRPRARRR